MGVPTPSPAGCHAVETATREILATVEYDPPHFIEHARAEEEWTEKDWQLWVRIGAPPFDNEFQVEVLRLKIGVLIRERLAGQGAKVAVDFGFGESKTVTVWRPCAEESRLVARATTVLDALADAERQWNASQPG
jgi:hypothetical protein